MDERGQRLSPSESGVAIPDEPIEFKLSPTQQRAAELKAVEYLKKYKIPMTQTSLRGVLGVIGIDAVQRGLFATGRQSLGGNDDIRPLINKGLEAREEVKTRAKEALARYTVSTATSTEPIVGPFAFATSDVIKAQGELQNGLISPLQTADKLAKEYTYRSVVLPGMAQRVIDALPSDQFEGVSLEKFPTPDERAKLVRNSMLSTVFRGSPLPVISIEDLADFVSNDEKVTKFAKATVNTDFVYLLQPQSIVPLDIQERYLNDLYFQVASALSEKLKTLQEPAQLTHESIIYERDVLYAHFNKTLLLVHPALEERPIIADPKKARPSDYSLWREDLSTQLGDVRIPNPQALQRAVRLWQGRGYDPERFQDGIKAWVTYERQQRQEADRVVSLEEHRKELERELQDFGRYPDKLPTEHYLYLVSAVTRDAYRGAKDTVVKYDRLQDLRQQNISEWTDYLDYLKSTYGDSLPAEVEKPSWLIKRQERAVEGTHRSKESRNESQLLEYIGAFERSRRIYDNVGSIDYLYWTNLSIEEITTYIDELKQLGSVGIKRDIQSISKKDILSYFDRYLETVRMRVELSQRVYGDASRTKTLRHLRSVLQRERSTEPSEEFLDAFTHFRVSDASSYLKKIAEFKEALDQPVEEIDVSVTWSQNEISAFDQRLRYKSEVALTGDKEVDKGNLEEAQRFARSARYVLQLLPHIIPPQEEMLTALQRRQEQATSLEADAMYHLVKYYPALLQLKFGDTKLSMQLFGDKEELSPEDYFHLAREASIILGRESVLAVAYNRVENLRYRQTCTQNMIDDLHNPLIDFNAAVGLRRSEFVDLLTVRLRLARANIYMDESRNEEAEAKIRLEHELRAKYLDYLRFDLVRTDNEIDKLLFTPPSETKFMETMGKLNLRQTVIPSENS